MSGHLFYLLLTVSVFLKIQDSRAVYVDPTESAKTQCCDTSTEMLSLVEQMNTKMATWESNLQAQFANLKTEMDAKIELHVMRLENHLLGEFKTMSGQLTSSEDKIQGLEGQMSALETNNELRTTRLENELVDKLETTKSSIVESLKTENKLYITELENKLVDKLETTKSSTVDSILTGSKYELMANNYRIIEGVGNELSDIRQTLLTDGKNYIDSLENVTNHIKTSIRQASSSLAHSGTDLSSNITFTLNEFQNNLVVENERSVSSFQNFTGELSKSIGEAAALVIDVSKNISFSADRNERNVLNLADNVNSQIATSAVNLTTIVDKGVADLKESLKDYLNNQSAFINDLSTFFPIFDNAKIVFDQSCHKNMNSFFLTFDKYIIPSQVNEVINTSILCDAVTEGGGWIVIQRRVNWDISFYRNWDSYKEGFGSITGDFWLGLENIHKLTSSAEYELRVDLKYNGTSGYAKYSSFEIGSELEKYKLALGSYSGTAGDSMSSNNGMKFSTYDKDNDNWNSGHCASKDGGAWWYRSCSFVKLNSRQEETKRYFGTVWGDFSDGYSVTYSEMKIRKVESP